MLRRTLCSALGAILAAGMPAPDPARSQAAYPDHPVTLVVPAAAGGRGDIVAHLLAERLSGGLGQRVIVENKAGASGNIGNAGVARAPLDGYTLLHAYSDNHVTNPARFAKLAWAPRDFAPVALTVKALHVVVRRDRPVGNLAELVAYAKANPGKLTYTSSGLGSIQHIRGEVLQQITSAAMVHVVVQDGLPTPISTSNG